MSTEDDAGSEPNEASPLPGSAGDSPEKEASDSEDRPRRARTGKSGKRARERRLAEAQAASSATSSRLLVFVVAALAAGAAGGWFGHIAQANAKLRADSAPSPAGSGAARGPCGVWEKKLCAGSGDKSATCEQAKGASGLLSAAACELALEGVPATLARVKAERAPCDSLVAKLCKDLPPGSAACTLVTERTGSFPVSRCQELLKNYDSVLTEVKMIDQQGVPGGGDPHGGVPVGMPPGMPQGMPPGMPQGMPQGVPQPH